MCFLLALKSFLGKKATKKLNVDGGLQFRKIAFIKEVFFGPFPGVKMDGKSAIRGGGGYRRLMKNYHIFSLDPFPWQSESDAVNILNCFAVDRLN